MTAADGDPTDRDRTDGDPTDDGLDTASRGRVRRAPRYVPFISTGALLGIAAAVVLALVLPPVEQLDTRAALGYLGLVLGLVGGLVGAAVAVVLDRQHR